MLDIVREEGRPEAPARRPGVSAPPAFVDFRGLPDGSWAVRFECPSGLTQLGDAPSPRLALDAALRALEGRAARLELARTELERLEHQLEQVRHRRALVQAGLLAGD